LNKLEKTRDFEQKLMRKPAKEKSLFKELYQFFQRFLKLGPLMEIRYNYSNSLISIKKLSLWFFFGLFYFNLTRFSHFAFCW
jgi:hypothetical protein